MMSSVYIDDCYAIKIKDIKKFIYTYIKQKKKKKERKKANILIIASIVVGSGQMRDVSAHSLAKKLTLLFPITPLYSGTQAQKYN